MMNAVKRFFSQVWLYGKAMTGPFDLLEFFFYKVGYSLLSICFYCIIASFASGEVDLTRWVVGNAFTLCITECIFRLGGTFSNERYFGRLRSIIASPTNNLSVVVQNGTFAILTAFISIAGGFIAGGLIFGVNFSELDIPRFAISILAAVISMAGLGLFISVFALLTDSIHLVLNTAASLLIIFSGANFPVSQLPYICRVIARIFPLYRSVQAANMCFGNRITDDFWLLILGEALLGVCFYIATVLMLRIIERIAVNKATLEMF